MNNYNNYNKKRIVNNNNKGPMLTLHSLPYSRLDGMYPPLQLCHSCIEVSANAPERGGACARRAGYRSHSV